MKVAVLFILLASPSAPLLGQTSGPPTTEATPAPQATPNFPRGGRGSALPTVPTVGNAEGGTAPDGLALQQLIIHTYAEPLYRKATERELLDVAPPSGIANHYADLLRKPRTGIFRLTTDSGCSENSKVINANDECLKYTVPGAGNSYSFRVGTYRLKDLSDLNYSNNTLGVSGLMMNGIMVDLGDVPVENVNLQTPGVDFIVRFQPAGDFEVARVLNDQYVAGIERDGLLYRRFLPAKENSTYVLRAVAYHGKLMRSVRGVPYNEFDFDKRRDVIVAFRVAYRDADGSLVIVWKQLISMDSPKLKMPVTEK